MYSTLRSCLITIGYMNIELRLPVDYRFKVRVCVFSQASALGFESQVGGENSVSSTTGAES